MLEEEIMKLPWSAKTPRTDEENEEFYCYNFDEDDETDVFYCHLNEIDPIFAGERSEDFNISYDPCIDPRTGQEVQELEIDCNMILSPPKLFNEFRTRSKLNKYQHKMCLDAMTDAESWQIDKAKQLKASLEDKIKEENKLYNDFVKSYFLANLLERKNYIDPEKEQVFMDRYQPQMDKRVFSLTHNYQLVTALPVQSEEYQVALFEFKERISSTGTPRELSMSFEDVCEKREAKSSFLHLKRLYESELVQYISLADDRFVKEAFEKRQTTFAISFCSLKRLLLSTVIPELSWMIPVEIDESITGATTVIIEKHLPSIDSSSVDRSRKIHKHLLKAIYTRPSETEQVDEILCEGSDEGEIIEQNEALAAHGTSMNEYKIVEFDTFLEQYEKTHPTISRIEPHYNYDLWQLSAGNSAIKETSELLLRYKCDCSNNLAFSTKIEYQPEFGAEQMTKEELVVEWCRHFFKSLDRTKRVRMHYQTSLILSLQDLTLPSIERDLKNLYNIEPEKLLRNITNLLQLLKGFPIGSYLMRRNPKTNDNIMVYRLSEEGTVSSFDLKQHYLGASLKRSKIEEHVWCPIDPNEVLPLHKNSGLLPATFPYWIKDRAIVRDRPRVVKPKAEPLKKKKSKGKKSSKANKKRLTTRQKLLKNFQGADSVDPELLFDKTGAINLTNLLSGNSNAEEKKDPSTNVPAEEIDLNAYMSEALGEKQLSDGTTSDTESDFTGFDEKEVIEKSTRMVLRSRQVSESDNKN